MSLLADNRALPIEAMVISGIEYPATGLVQYVFPLRPDLDVRLILPRDLTMAEVRRLEAFLHALQADEPAEDREAQHET